MKPSHSIVIFKLLLFHYLSAVCHSQDFDFFYFVQQWPGAYCDTKRSCCYPKTGRPAADFGIHGLWPNFQDGTYPSSCDPDSVFDPTHISEVASNMAKQWPSLSCPSSNGLRFWSHEWEKHGTCSQSELDQKEYFEAAMKLKQKAKLLKLLNGAGIEPNDEFYSLESIRNAIEEGLGFTPGIQCNRDSAGNPQLYQIYLCVDTSASEFIKCPVLPKAKCASTIQFPKF
ncbi:ribonuclease 3-like [Momordica charantia]|uniref:Ribonuclease 3-like n=1 Tax=Momordica charantia TaxID=3673 RepID=A0A6J1DCA6_MOMCH|nr:ribonuclease 3-like [Momordica charantia]